MGPIDKNNVLCLVLAGGEGKRLQPLTSDRAKPAVPFGGTHRLIDFALSNLVNSGFNKIAVLTQYKSQSLNLHIARNWQMNARFGNFIMVVPPQQRYGKDWYLGSADAIFQSQNVIKDNDPEYLIVIGADHVYRMDFSQMLTQHVLNRAQITVAGFRQPRAQASEFGVIEVDPARPERIRRFWEKPTNPVGLPDAPDQALVSMGNYIANRADLEEAIRLDHANSDSKNDMGGDIVPYFTERNGSFVYDFSQNQVPGASPEDQSYWRDVGSIEEYFAANLDLVSVVPKFNMYNKLWPIHTNYPGLPPAKFLFNEDNRIGYAKNSLVGPGSIISGAKVSNSIISTEVRIGSFSEIAYSILFPNVTVERSVKLHRVIVDKYANIPPGLEIGFDAELDRSRGFRVTDSGITVVPRFWNRSSNV